MSKRLDIVLFGATGFTGKRCISEINRLTKTNGRLLTWGIAGRSEIKLKQLLDDYQNKTGINLSFIPIIIADVNNEESLKNMAALAKIIINCCGPYRLYGEPVVKACVETATHYIDVTGEPQFMETIQLKYNKPAEEKGIYIISACGVDSTLADLGVVFLQNNFKGTLNSVETYLEMNEEEPKMPGAVFNYATWESAIYGLTHAKELKDLRKQLFPKPLPNLTPKLKPRSLIHKSKLINAWGVPFLGAERSVIVRTQRYLYENEKIRPVQVQTYEGVKSLVHVLYRVFYGGLFMNLTKYECGRKLLLQNPELFSAGVFSHEEPSDKKLERQQYRLTLHGKGWEKQLSESEQNCKTPPNKNIYGYLACMNPAYGITSIVVTLAAIVVITEGDKLPQRGGVYTPGVAFAKTSLFEQLQKNGLSFQIKSKL